MDSAVDLWIGILRRFVVRHAKCDVDRLAFANVDFRGKM